MKIKILTGGLISDTDKMAVISSANAAQKAPGFLLCTLIKTTSAASVSRKKVRTGSERIQFI